MRRGAPPHSRVNIALETDIGHDCDDLQALIVALKDHINGVVRIVYIATVSQANVRRAQLVQWLCGRMGVSDIPIVPSQREVARVGTKALNNCVDVWQFALNKVSGGTRPSPSMHARMRDHIASPGQESVIATTLVCFVGCLLTNACTHAPRFRRRGRSTNSCPAWPSRTCSRPATAARR
jgi:hypothetical protein